MKLKWPKFLTVKRTILLALLLVVIIFVLIYFLGGFKPSKLDEDKMPFSTEGFVSFEDIVNEQIVKNEEEFNTLINGLNVANYDDNIAEVVEKCMTAQFKTQLMNKLDDLKAEDADNAEKYSVTIDNAGLITAAENAKKSLNNFELVLDTSNNAEQTGYQLYFNYRMTSFKIVKVENGVEVNEWYSNPNNTDYTAGSGSTLNNQLSPIILHYYTPSGATLPYNAYEYAINDDLGDSENHIYVDPTFSIKVDAANNAIQVLYKLEKKGYKYSDFPKYISETRFNELIQRNTDFVTAEVAAMQEYSEDELMDYFNLHYATRYIRYPQGTIYDGRYSYIGVEAYKYINDIDSMDARYRNLEPASIPSLIQDYTIEELREFCIVMFELEHQFFVKGNKYISGGYAKNDEIALTAFYKRFDDQELIDEVYYGNENYEGMTGSIKEYYNQIFTKKFQYTLDDLATDQNQFGVEVETTDASFQVAVEYKLTNEGFKATIINNSLVESNEEDYPIYMIELLPYFSAISSTYAQKEVEVDASNKTSVIYSNPQASNGYIVIPDGSGGLIELNNGKSSYSKRVYTTDLAFGKETKQTAAEDILLPMYALSYESIDFDGTEFDVTGSSIIARATKGAAQMTLNANVSTAANPYNRVSFSAIYRESQEVIIGTGAYESRVTRVTENSVQSDYTVEYSLINEQGLTYSDIAKRYQEMLFGDIISEENTDQTNSTVLNAELLGLYDYTTNFLGIVYDGYDSLTTYSQAVEITKQLKDWGAQDINVMYLGWRDGGLVNETFKDMSFSNKLGSKKEYNEMLTYFKQNNISLYPVVSFYEINEFDESFGKIRYATRDVSSEFTEKYPYDLASSVYDKSKRAIYTLSPKFFEKFATIMAENFVKENEDLHSMSFQQLGSKIVGDYEKRQEFFRFNSVLEQVTVFDILEENNINDLSLTAPYEYAVKYADNIVELPYSSTLLEIFNYSIPFYQLVFSGYRDYSGTIINANDEKGLNNHIMKILETGSNIEFTFSYDSSDELIQTDYNNYYYTQYSDWQNEVQSLLTVLDTLELHKYYLASHETVNNNSTVFKVTYKVKEECKATVTDQEFSIYLNYSDMKINLGTNNLTYVDVNNSDPFGSKLTNGILNPWSCATDKEVA